MKDDAKHTQLNEAKWDKWAEKPDDKGWIQKRLRKDQSKVISLMDFKENTHFLDAGCGTGWAVGEVAKLVNNKGLFYGIDLSPKMIEKAKDNFSGQENFHFIKANAESIPLDGDFFDIIICTNSFHHYLHPDRATNEFYRLLKKGGKVYILDATTDVWFAKIVDMIFRLLEAEHVKHYSTKEYQQLFHNAGLKYSVSKKIKGNSKVHIGEK
jgi:ubiquinone/menaquinone biosynthesis C-methylase UbiE